MRCRACVGTGEVLGGGFMLTECKSCKGTGVEREVSSDAPVSVKAPDKRSKSYKEAVKKIAELHPDLSYEECAKIFDEEYSRIA